MGLEYANLNERQRRQLAAADLRVITAAARIAGSYGVPVALPAVSFDASGVADRGGAFRAVADALDTVAAIVEAD